MGAWGTGSHDCDSVMDNVDGCNSKAQTLAQSNKLLKGVKSSSYDKTEFAGTVLFLAELGSELSVANVEKAVAELEKALKDNDYLNTWNKPEARIESIKSELKFLKKFLTTAQAIPPKVKAKKLKEGQEVKFRFDVDLDDLAGSGGIEGINNMLDDAWHNANGYVFTMTDIGYKIVAHKEDGVTLEAHGVLECIV